MTERRRITPENLKKAFDDLPERARQNGQTESLALACGVVRGFLGEKWFEQHIDPNSKAKGYLTIDESDVYKQELSFFKIMDLAELLYNLQHIEGFDDCINRIKGGAIEATYAELDFGRLLHYHLIPFRFVIARGILGADYDFEIMYPNGVIACADAKCKIEATQFGDKTILNALQQARTQLPKNRPGIIFVKMPQHWMRDEDSFVATTVAVARRFLSSTKRIVSVKFYVSPLSFSENILVHRHGYKEVSNPVTYFGNDINWDIFYKIGMTPEQNGVPLHWQRIKFYPDGRPR